MRKAKRQSARRLALTTREAFYRHPPPRSLAWKTLTTLGSFPPGQARISCVLFIHCEPKIAPKFRFSR